MTDQRSSELLELIDGLTVEELDRQLAQLGRQYHRVLQLRTMIATEQGNRTPPPLLPISLSSGNPQPQSALTWRQLAEQFKSSEHSPYRNLKFTTRDFYDGLIRRVLQDLGEGRRVADMSTKEAEGLFDMWNAAGKTSMAKSLTGMVRNLVNFGSKVMTDPECARLSVPFHRMRHLSRPGLQPKVGSLTKEQAKAIIQKAHERGYPSIALAQAIQFECGLLQRDVIGEWVPIKNPDEIRDSDIVVDGRKWARGLEWSNLNRLILTHRAGRAAKEVEIDLSHKELVLDELLRLGNSRPTKGPMIVHERTDLPYEGNQFRYFWRVIATDAGIPKSVKNMDNRNAVRDGEP